MASAKTAKTPPKRPRKGAKSGPKRAAGRPSKLVPSIAKAILDALEAGSTLEAAAGAASVSPRVVYAWISSGKAPTATPALADFASSVERARHKAESEALDAVRKGVNVAGLPDWRAAEVWLRLTRPDKYGAKAVNDRKIKAEVQSIVSAVLARVSPEAAGEVLRALELEFRLRGLLGDESESPPAPKALSARSGS